MIRYNLSQLGAAAAYYANSQTDTREDEKELLELLLDFLGALPIEEDPETETDAEERGDENFSADL